jgi:TIR domain
MLLLNINLRGEAVVHGFARCRWPGDDHVRTGRIPTWARLFVRSALLWRALEPLSAAIRVAAYPDRPLETIHSFVVAKSQEARLRLVLAAFQRTHEIAGGTCDAPQQQSDLAGAYVHQGEPRLAISAEVLRTGSGVRIHNNVRLIDCLARLIQTFVDMRMAVAYEAQIVPWAPSRDLLRQALYDASRLQELSIPGSLLQDQTALAARLRQAAQQVDTYHLEECLSSPVTQDMNAFAASASNVLSDTIYGRFGAAPRLRALDTVASGSFAFHVHSFLRNGESPAAQAQPVSAVALKEEVDRLLSVETLGLEGAGDAGGAPSGPEPIFTTMTSPGRGVAADARASRVADKDPFLFVSYARTDSSVVYPLCQQLVERGISLWMDRNIIGGDDWLDELEAKLINCVGVLALVSPSFVASRYCLREMGFADALSRPIVPIYLSPVELRGGINFILHPIQRVALYDGGGHEAILAAIKRQAPNAVRGIRR